MPSFRKLSLCKCQVQMTFSFLFFFPKISALLNIEPIIWYQHGKCIRMSTNKPIFGPVVLEIAWDIFINKTSSFHCNMQFALSLKLNWKTELSIKDENQGQHHRGKYVAVVSGGMMASYYWLLNSISEWPLAMTNWPFRNWIDQWRFIYNQIKN